MGTEGRREDASVDGLQPLFDAPFCFDFIQAVRLLHADRGARGAVGYDALPGEESVRFSVHRDLGFPASQIHDLTQYGVGPPLMTVAFMGLVGPSGILPTHYSELVIEEMGPDGERGPLADFLDMFHHRLISFFYRGWERNHLHLSPEPAVRAAFQGYLLALVGALSTPRTEEDLGLLRHAGLWAQRRRSAEGLRILLVDFLNDLGGTRPKGDEWIEAEIVPFVARWLDLEEERQFKLEPSGPNVGLGRGALLGRRVRDWQGRFCVRIGPLTLEQFERLQPPSPMESTRTSSSFVKVTELTRRYSGPEFEFEVVLLLRADQVPTCKLRVGAGSRLGRSWLTTRRPPRDKEAGFRAAPANTRGRSTR